MNCTWSTFTDILREAWLNSSLFSTFKSTYIVSYSEMFLAIKNYSFLRKMKSPPPPRTNTHIKYTVLLLFYLNIY